MKTLWAFLLALFLVWHMQSAAEAAKALEVVHSSPQGQVSQLTQITIRFSEDMAPLGSMENDIASTPARIIPSQSNAQLPAGNWRWLDTATLAYMFAAPQTGSVAFTVTVPAGMKALNGATLQKDVSWQIACPLIDIKSYSSSLGPKGSITLGANQAIDVASLRAHLGVTVNSRPAQITLQEQAQTGRYQGQTEIYYYTVSIKNPLPPDADIALKITAGVAPQHGFIKSAQSFNFNFKSYAGLKLESWRVGWHNDGNFNADKPLILNFNNAVALSDLLEHLSISPSVNIDSKARTAPPSTSQAIACNWRPRTAYQVTIKPGLKDSYGTTLGKPITVQVKIGDFEPFIKLGTGMRVVEAALGGICPIITRNLSPIEIFSKFYPWNKESLQLASGYRSGGDTTSGAPKQTLNFSSQFNSIVNHRLLLQELVQENQESGLIALNARYPNPRSANSDTSEVGALLQVSDLGLSFKLAENQGLAWVTSINTGQPLAGVDLSICDMDGRKYWEGISDENGLCQLPGAGALKASHSLPILMASRGQTKTVLPLSWSGDIYDGQPNHIPWPTQMRAHMVSQLPLYQPGEHVEFTAFIRTSTRNGWQALADEEVRLEVRDSRGQVIYNEKGTTNAYGSMAGKLDLSSEASLGYYSLYVYAEAASPSAASAFQVAAFRPPDFKIDLSTPPSLPIGKQTLLQSTLNAAYFFGAPLANAKASMKISQQLSYFAPERLNGYRVGTAAPWRGGYQHFGERSGSRATPIGGIETTLNSQGQAVFDLPAARIAPGESATITLEALVTDPAGLTSQGNTSYAVYASEYFVGVKSPCLVKENEAITLQLKAATYDNKAVANAKVTISATRLHSDASPFKWQDSTDINSAEGRNFKFTLAESGIYEIKVSIKDNEGRENITTTNISVVGRKMTWQGNWQERGLELMSDGEQYAPGDVAKIVIKNPFDVPARALITTEKAGILQYWTQKIDEPAPTIEVPLTKDNTPYTFVSVLLIKGRSAAPPQDGEDLGAPKVMTGSILLKVADESKAKFSVELKTDHSAYRPSGLVKVAVKASESCQLTLLAVDKRILRAAGRDSYEAGASFAEVIWRGVATADLRTRLLNLAAISDDDSNALEKNALSLAQPAPMAAMARSREMAEEPASSGDDAARSNFSPAAYWLASVETNASGAYEDAFTLPDSLTAYEVVAIAADRQGGFATARQEITASLPLQLTSSLPRFITQGDELMAQFLVHNLSGHAGEIELELNVNGIELASPPRQQIKAAAGQSVAVNFQVKAFNVGQAEFVVKASMDNEKDSVKFKIPVLPALPLTTVAAAGLLQPEEQYSLPVDIPEDIDSRSRLQIILAPSPAAGLPLTAQEITNYPWDCLEQRLTKACLRIARLTNGEVLGLEPEKDDREAAQAVFNSVAKFQNSDGGFCLWPGMGQRSEFYLTCYVMLAAMKGSQVDISMNARVVEQALRFIATSLNQSANNELSLDAQAFAVWILASHKASGAKEHLLRFTKLADKMNPLGQAALMLAYKELGLDQPKDFLIALEKHIAISPTQMHFNTPYAQRFWYTMGSPLKDNAFVLWALCKTNPHYSRLEALAMWVSQVLGEKTYLSTQEAIFGLWGLGAYLESLGGNQAISVSAKWKQEQMQAAFSKLVEPAIKWEIGGDKLQPGAGALVFSAASGKPYWSARLSYSSMQSQRPVNAGFSISRKWLTPGPWHMGQTVEVEITVTAPNYRRHVLVYDPFPAGLEPLYATRADLASQNLRYYPPWQWQEMREHGLLLYTAAMAPGTYSYKYQLRAFAPGVFVKRCSQVEEMYTPEVFARDVAEKVEVKP